MITAFSLANCASGDYRLLHGGMSRIGKRRGVMGHEQPTLFTEHKYIRGLHHGIVKAIGKRGRDVLGASYPPYVAFNSDPDGTQCYANASRVGEKSSPAVMNFFPAQQKFPAGMNALDFFVVGPHGFHQSEVKGFEGGIKTRVCGTKSIFGSLFLLHGLRGHRGAGNLERKV